jgi:peptidoglycan/LPS O-acetylase OafA/YrhL
VLDAIGLAACGLAAWMMYQIIEKPSQEMSSAIRFVHPKPERASQAAVVAATLD